MMRTRISGLLLATTLGLTSLLTACGSDDDEPDTDATSQTSDSTDVDDDATETDDADDTDAPETDDADGDKPDRDDVIEGYTKIVQDTAKDAGMEMPDSLLTKVVTCVVDAVYDKASVKTLEALEDGNAAGIDPADAGLFTDSATTCQSAAN